MRTRGTRHSIPCMTSTATASPATGVVRGIYDAFARGDLGSLFSALDERIEWDSPAGLPWSHGLHIGPEAVAGYLTRFLEHVDEPSVTPEEILDAGEGRVVTVGRVRGILRA